MAKAKRLAADEKLRRPAGEEPFTVVVEPEPEEAAQSAARAPAHVWLVHPEHGEVVTYQAGELLPAWAKTVIEAVRPAPRQDGQFIVMDARVCWSRALPDGRIVDYFTGKVLFPLPKEEA